MRALIAGLGLLLLMLSNLALAQNDRPVASVDRQTVALGEILELRIRVPPSLAQQTPDWSALQEQFFVHGTGRQTQIELFGGQTRQITSWRVQLEPKRVGRQSIPAVPIGPESTRPVAINVQETVASASGDQEVIVELKIEPSSGTIHVGQQLSVTLNFLLAVNLANGDATSLDVPDARIERVGSEETFQTTRNGKQYRGVRQRYALSTETPGTLSIGPINFVGQVADPRGGLFSNAGRRVRASAERVSVEVLDVPEGADLPFLPARNLTLGERYDGLEGEVRVGDAITREISMEAAGLFPDQLPEIEMTTPDGTRLYPEQSQRTALPNEESGWLDANSQKSFAIVPTQAGPLTLPPVTVRWFDVSSDSMRTARLPGRTIQVLPGTGPSAAGSASAPGVAATEAGGRFLNAPIWFWPGLAITASLLLLLSLWRGRRGGAAASSRRTQRQGLRQTVAEIHRCARDEDRAALERALLNWSHEHPGLGDVRNLDQLSAHLRDDKLRSAVSELQRQRYGPPGPARPLPGAFAQWPQRVELAAAEPPAPDERREELRRLYP